MQRVLAVDANRDTYHEHLREWDKLGIEVEYAASMLEAIAYLTGGGEYILVAINEEPDTHFLPQLQLMRDVAEAQLFVYSHHYDVENKLQVIQHGADSYDPHGRNARTNVHTSMELIDLHSRLAGRSVRKLPVLHHGSIALSPARRRVFVGNTELTLGKIEFELLYHFLRNNDIVLSYEKLYRRVWNASYSEEGHELLWHHVSSLRKKLEKAPGYEPHIHTVNGVGYQFRAPRK